MMAAENIFWIYFVSKQPNCLKTDYISEISQNIRADIYMKNILQLGFCPGFPRFGFLVNDALTFHDGADFLVYLMERGFKD